MNEHNNPGPPERCYDDCPMNHTGNSEDCTCAGTMLDSDAALFARQRDDAQAIVLSVSRILGISHLADGLEHGRVTDTVRSWMDTAGQVTRERDAAGAKVGRLRVEIEHLTKRADANGRNARFWADHFAEIEHANRDALGAHHKPGHSVAELIAAVVGELAEVRASREAWVLEADRLDVIATESCLVTHPWECGRDESDCTNDDSCPCAEERYATADDLMGVMALSEEVARLTRERDEARNELAAIRAKLAEVHDAAQYDDITTLRAVEMLAEQRDSLMAGWGRCHERHVRVEGEVSRPAIPADAVVLPDNWETQIRQALNARAYDISEAGPLPGTSSHDRDADRCADEIAGDVVVMINDWMSAPVSGSDTTADER